MGSNNCLSSSGGGSGNDGYGGVSLYSKKQRRQKVPKRGLGVAELEKILRDQEKKSDHLSLDSPFSASNSLPGNSKNFTAPAHAQPLGDGGNNGRNVGGTGMYLPEQNHLGPKMWNGYNDGDNVDAKFAARFQFAHPPFNGSGHKLFPSSTDFMQNTTQHSPPSMKKNLFPNQTTLQVRNCNGRERPSIQTLYDPSSSWPEQDKMVGERRGRTVVVGMEVPPVPTFQYRNPTFSAQMSKFYSPFDHSISREMREATTCLKPNRKRSHGESSDSANLLLMFPSATTPPSLIHTPNIFNPFPFQENNGDIHQMPNTQVGGSIRKKPFYSFLQPFEKNSFNTERVETKGDGIDLELRL